MNSQRHQTQTSNDFSVWVKAGCVEMIPVRFGKGRECQQRCKHSLPMVSRAVIGNGFKSSIIIIEFMSDGRAIIFNMLVL